MFKARFERSLACAQNYGGMEGDSVIVDLGPEYAQLTYEYLRSSPNGEFVATWDGNTWRLPEGGRYSDVVIYIEEAT